MEACRHLQLDLHKVAIRARQAPRKQDLLDLIDLLASLSWPALIHCKSGADRTGFVTAVYLLTVEHRPVEDALKQLSLRFGHLRYSRAGVLRFIVESYARAGSSRPDFRTWVEHHYDPEQASLHFRLPAFATAFTARLLRWKD
jgi:hypothetical protein